MRLEYFLAVSAASCTLNWEGSCSALLASAQIGRAPSELQSPYDLVCRLLLEKKKIIKHTLNFINKQIMLINLYDHVHISTIILHINSLIIVALVIQCFDLTIILAACA